MSQLVPHKFKHLVVVATNYPSSEQPAQGAFVQQFAHALARQGVHCTVINPVAFHRVLRRPPDFFRTTEEAGGGQIVEVFRPRYISLSARESFAYLGPFSPSLLTLYHFTKAINRVLCYANLRPDALYGHFLFLAGAAVVRIGRKMNLPAFPGVGEGELWTVRQFGTVRARSELSDACGFLANSSALKKTLLQDLSLDADRVGVFPNGIDPKVFWPHNRQEMRRKYHLPKDSFLVASVGNFLFKKGILRVGEAIEGLNGVAGVFVGSGPVPPTSSNMALCRPATHSEIPELLSACDAFVLPTLIEGSCNAIVEAMACGLPIISSDGDFNDDLLSSDMSIRVDPMNILAIRQAILRLRDDSELRTQMAASALNKSQKYNINTRAYRMLTFMAELSEKHTDCREYESGYKA